MSSIVPTSGNRFIPADVLPSMELITAILKGDSNRLGSILQKLPLNDSTTTEPKIGGGSGGGGGHKRSKSQQVLDINFVTPDEKRTALHFSSSTGSVQCTELLLKQGNIHIDAQDFQGNSPLHLAVICEELDIVKILVKAGADVFLHNFRGTRPLDCAKNGDIQAFLTETMISQSANNNELIHYPEAFQLETELPDNLQMLKHFVMELVVSHHIFQERCKETIHQLIEEKHIALHKTRLIESALGITDQSSSERFLDQLQYWQDENERQTATIAFLKIRIAKLENDLSQQEDLYRRSIAEVIKQHTDQLHAIYRRNEETEKAFLAFQKSHAEDVVELARLKAEVAFGNARKGNSKPDTNDNIQTQNEMNRQISQLNAEKLALMERLKLTENLKAMLEKENNQLRSDLSERHRNIQNEELRKLMEAKAEQDKMDERNGLVVFIHGEGVKRIKAATSEKLIDQLLDPTQPDLQYMQTFFLSYSLFMEAKNLLADLFAKFKKATNSEDASVQSPIQIRVIAALKNWITNYWSDFDDDPTLISSLENFISELKNEQFRFTLRSEIEKKENNKTAEVQIDRSQAIYPKPMLPKVLMKRYEAGNPRSVSGGSTHTLNKLDSMTSISSNSTANLPESTSGTGGGGKDRPVSLFNFGTKAGKLLLDPLDLKLIEMEPLEIARQLTLIEFELFSSIKTRELLDLAWMKPDKDAKSPNLLRMTKWSNHVVNWMISEIVLVKDSAKARALVVEKAILIAQQLEKLHNYNGLKEILAALQSSSVYRLKKTKESISSKHLKILDDLNKITSSELNYKNLRAKVHSGDLPLIPFPGVYQGDLVYLDTCSKNRLDGGLINFHKLEKSTALISELQEIQAYLKNYQILDDDTAYSHSLICEPRT